MNKKRAQIIPAPQDLKRKAVNYHTGVDINLPSEKLEELERVIQRSAGTFVSEIGEELQTLRVAYREIQRNPSQRDAYFKQVAQAAYRIKGMGSTFDFPLLSEIAASLMLLTTGLIHPTQKQIEVTRLHVDALHVIVLERITGGGRKLEQATKKALIEAGARFAPVLDDTEDAAS